MIYRQAQRRSPQPEGSCGEQAARPGDLAVRHLAQDAIHEFSHLGGKILRTLMGYPGRVYSRRMLLEVLWGSSDFRDPRTIDVHVRHLREKLEPDSSRPEYILTVRSVGYRFRDP